MNKPDLQASVASIIGAAFMFCFKLAIMLCTLWLICIVGVCGVESLRLDRVISLKEVMHDGVYTHAAFNIAAFIMCTYQMLGAFRTTPQQSADADKTKEDEPESDKQ